ncbi:MAG: RcpC/CpaB family pilus assembly protein [Acidimicrobiia bacterium]|nr:RcpC/CpaB family pilus assembly protein [Acidimicrobiia bacterium]
MSRRVIGIVAALLLALVGTGALVAYVSTAEARALAGEELVEVYVVSSPIPAGTPAAEVEQFVTVEQVPAKVQATEAVDNLPSLTGTVTAVDLLPGEQLVDGRFVPRSEFADRLVGVQVPDDMVEVTVELDPQRAVGGLLEPGHTVAILASFEPFDLNATVVEVDGEEVALPEAVAAAIDGKTPNSTDVILRKVLVTAVQEIEDRTFNDSNDEEVDRLTTAPNDSVFVTLAVRPVDAERIVFTSEFGFLWLAIDRETVPEIEDPIQTRGTIYDDQVLPQ